MKKRKTPDLEKYLEGKKRRFVNYTQGAKIYRMSYWSFVLLAKKAEANYPIRKTAIVDLNILDDFLVYLQGGFCMSMNISGLGNAYSGVNTNSKQYKALKEKGWLEGVIQNEAMISEDSLQMSESIEQKWILK